MDRPWRTLQNIGHDHRMAMAAPLQDPALCRLQIRRLEGPGPRKKVTVVTNQAGHRREIVVQVHLNATLADVKRFFFEMEARKRQASV